MENAYRVLIGIKEEFQIEVEREARNVTTESCTRKLNVRRPGGQLVDSYDVTTSNALTGGYGSVTWTRTFGAGESSIPVDAPGNPSWN